ncbi:Dihydroneopterin aldolase-domain-containing protein [Lineolata rhizophorae]|uniref:dihydroneopterin aldolase n=1 Tax=Lineolata rhizophorae TaxID=578093 RepID=A0A6A6P394_9PEZI|nr:Dihydroneopterin aldolase-domain-containing protein [Lineolata rhizophorae]
MNIFDQDEWDRDFPPIRHDIVAVRNLAVTALAGKDVWGRSKSQPAFVSVWLFLSNQFASAAAGDVLDESTVHYGNLSKNIMEEVARHRNQNEWKTTSQLADLILDAAMRTDDRRNIIDSGKVQISYPKASMLGDGVEYCVSSALKAGAAAPRLYLKNLRVPAVIGVNSHERNLRQVVVANIWIEGVHREASDSYSLLERVVTTTLEASSFETLETLAVKIAQEVIKGFIEPVSPGAKVRVRLEKPSAVPFADAPLVEICRG